MAKLNKYSYTRPGRKSKRGSKTPVGKNKATKKRFAWFRNLSRKKKIALILGPILALLIIIPVATYIYYANDIKDQERLMNRNNTGVVFLDKDGEAFYTIGRAEQRNLVPLDDISDHLQEALIASEDKDFYEHRGFNIFSIARAAVTQYGGGSTITQQLAKNTLLSSQQTYLRKYQELAISVAIEQNYTKDEILNMYLNSVYYGENAFGIEDAAQTYFAKSPSELDLAESSMLIGLLPAPSIYSPISGNKDYAKERQGTVLKRMMDNGYISQAEMEQASSQRLVYSDQETEIGKAPHFVEMVMEQLNESYGNEQVMRSGYQVTTTLDTELQRQMETNVTNHMPFINANGGSNASSIAINPENGHVLALVGSADYDNEQWGKVNMTTSARQPGSSYKPIYYAAALAEGTITPASVYADQPINLNGWQPRNADRNFRGDVTVRSAINQSLNIPSIKVMQDYGVQKSIEASERLGIDLDNDKDYGLALSLGTAEASLLDMTNAYAAFANEGTQHTPVIVTEIKDKFSNRIFESRNESRQSISQGGAFLISNILSDNSARAPIFGNSLTVPGRTAAVKTGTTDDARDAWTIGYTPSLAIGVWVGNNDNTAMLNGGAGMAGPIWRETMASALANRADERFVAPASVVERATCLSNNGIATNNVTVGTYREFYLSSALPSTTCTPVEPKPVEVCNTRNNRIQTVDEADLEDWHTRNLDACREDEEEDEPEVTTIQVCDTRSGQIITIDEDDLDPEIHSEDTENCTPPEDDEDDERTPPVTPGPPSN